MPEQNTPQLPENGNAKPVLPEAKPAEAEAQSKPVLPEAPKAVLPEAKPTLPKAPVLSFSDEAAPAKKPAAPSFELPKAKANVAFKPQAQFSRPAPARADDAPGTLSVAVDFIAAAVAVAFAVMIILDI